MAKLMNCSKPPEPVVLTLTHDEAQAAGLDTIEVKQTEMVADEHGVKRHKPGVKQLPPAIRILAGTTVDVPDKVLEAAQVKKAIARRKVRVADAAQVKETKPPKAQAEPKVEAKPKPKVDKRERSGDE